MWILYTHLIISIICVFVCLISSAFISDAKKEFIKMQSKSNTSNIDTFFEILFFSFIPIINILSACTTFYYCICPLEDYIKKTENNKKNIDMDAKVLKQYKKEKRIKTSETLGTFVVDLKEFEADMKKKALTPEFAKIFEKYLIKVRECFGQKLSTVDLWDCPSFDNWEAKTGYKLPADFKWYMENVSNMMPDGNEIIGQSDFGDLEETIWNGVFTITPGILLGLYDFDFGKVYEIDEGEIDYIYDCYDENGLSDEERLKNYLNKCALKPMYNNFLDYAIDMLRQLVQERQAQGKSVEYSCVTENFYNYLKRTDPENADELIELAAAFDDICDKLDEL